MSPSRYCRASSCATREGWTWRSTFSSGWTKMPRHLPRLSSLFQSNPPEEDSDAAASPPDASCWWRWCWWLAPPAAMAAEEEECAPAAPWCELCRWWLWWCAADGERERAERADAAEEAIAAALAAGDFSRVRRRPPPPPPSLLGSRGAGFLVGYGGDSGLAAYTSTTTTITTKETWVAFLLPLFLLVRATRESLRAEEKEEGELASEFFFLLSRQMLLLLPGGGTRRGRRGALSISLSLSLAWLGSPPPGWPLLGLLRNGESPAWPGLALAVPVLRTLLWWPPSGRGDLPPQGDGRKADVKREERPNDRQGPTGSLGREGLARGSTLARGEDKGKGPRHLFPSRRRRRRRPRSSGAKTSREVQPAPALGDRHGPRRREGATRQGGQEVERASVWSGEDFSGVVVGPRLLPGGSLGGGRRGKHWHSLKGSKRGRRCAGRARDGCPLSRWPLSLSSLDKSSTHLNSLKRDKDKILRRPPLLPPSFLLLPFSLFLFFSFALLLSSGKNVATKRHGCQVGIFSAKFEHFGTF